MAAFPGYDGGAESDEEMIPACAKLSDRMHPVGMAKHLQQMGITRQHLVEIAQHFDTLEQEPLSFDISEIHFERVEDDADDS